jgi:hypothetical protein
MLEAPQKEKEKIKKKRDQTRDPKITRSQPYALTYGDSQTTEPNHTRDIQRGNFKAYSYFRN